LNTSRRSTRSKSSEKRRKAANPEENVLKSSIETFTGKIILVQDLSTGKFLKPDEAERNGLINFLNGTYENTLTDERIKISEAIENGYIIIEKFANENARNRSASAGRNSNKSLLKSSSTYENYDDIMNANKVELSQQFEIVSVMDPLRKLNLELDEAIRSGIFDVSTGMYTDPRSNKKLTMIDAIDSGLIKLANNNAKFRTSYKLQIDEFDKNFVKHIRSHTLRYVVDPFTKDIVPINVAALKGLVDLDAGTYNGVDKILGFKVRLF
jgi:hypothetical protein